jgi:hypothetical protein
MSETIETANVSRPGLLDGLLTREQLEAETGWQWRTILRREAEGLPVVRLGATRLYPADKVKAWILSHVREHQAPTRGRPRKAA